MHPSTGWYHRLSQCTCIHCKLLSSTQGFSCSFAPRQLKTPKNKRRNKKPRAHFNLSRNTGKTPRQSFRKDWKMSTLCFTSTALKWGRGCGCRSQVRLLGVIRAHRCSQDPFCPIPSHPIPSAAVQVAEIRTPIPSWPICTHTELLLSLKFSPWRRNEGKKR